MNPRLRVAVTTDARVVSLARSSTGCAANIISRTGYRQASLPEGITCSRDPKALGNLILTSGDNTIIALH